jgi:hypothetical protein
MYMPDAPCPSYLHRLARVLMPRERLALCGVALRYGASGVVVRRLPDGRAAYSGLYRCGDFWRCPSCRVTLGIRRARQIESALRAHVVDVGGSALLATYTVPHARDESLLVVLARLSDTWRRYAKHAWRDALGAYYVGSVRALEVVHGVNGWHPHYHALLYISPGLPYLTPVAVALAERWSEVAGADWRADVRQVARDGVAAVARYLTTDGISGASYEVASPAAKVSSGRSYPEILYDYGRFRSSVDAALVYEYAAALHGVHHLTISPRLRKMYDFTDPASGWSAIADEDVLALLNSDEWLSVLSAGEERNLLDNFARSC